MGAIGEKDVWSLQCFLLFSPSHFLLYQILCQFFAPKAWIACPKVPHSSQKFAPSVPRTRHHETEGPDVPMMFHPFSSSNIVLVTELKRSSARPPNHCEGVLQGVRRSPGAIYGLSAFGTVSFIMHRQYLKGRRCLVQDGGEWGAGDPSCKGWDGMGGKLDFLCQKRRCKTTVSRVLKDFSLSKDFATQCVFLFSMGGCAR